MASPEIRLLSWNVNGVRAAHKKGFLPWLEGSGADVVCIQETKAAPEQLPPELLNVPGYHAFYEAGERAGYSGVALYSKSPPRAVRTTIGDKRFDVEGRIQIAEYDAFVLCNIYFPNGQSGPTRLAYKLAFYDTFLKYADGVNAAGKNVIICGDVNTAHKEQDLARPKENAKTSGFLPEERAWIDTLLNHGYVDTFRMFNDGGGNYTYWDQKTRARSRNVGWRIDYFFVNERFRGHVRDAFILPEVMGSDHCPVGLTVVL